MTFFIKNIGNVMDELSIKIKNFIKGAFNNTINKHFPMILKKVTIEKLTRVIDSCLRT